MIKDFEKNHHRKGKTFIERQHHIRWECGVRDWKERVEVRVMAIAEGYAMVRGKNEIPFVVDKMELCFED